MPPRSLLPFRAFSGVAAAVVLAMAGFLVGMIPVTASAGEDGFARGNRLYAAGKFAEAATAYESQVARGVDSANLFYNLGDAYYRVGNRGRAILNYRRALLLEPTHAEAAANLTFVGGSRGSATTNSSVLAPGVETLSWVAAAAGWLAAAGLLAAIFQRRWRIAGTVLAVAGVLGVAASAGAIWWTQGGTSPAMRALVVAETVPALYSPADNSKAITTLQAGAEVRILSAQGAWVYASLADGTRAWLSAEKVERLIPPR